MKSGGGAVSSSASQLYASLVVSSLGWGGRFHTAGLVDRNIAPLYMRCVLRCQLVPDAWRDELRAITDVVLNNSSDSSAAANSGQSAAVAGGATPVCSRDEVAVSPANKPARKTQYSMETGRIVPSPSKIRSSRNRWTPGYSADPLGSRSQNRWTEINEETQADDLVCIFWYWRLHIVADTILWCMVFTFQPMARTTALTRRRTDRVVPAQAQSTFIPVMWSPHNLMRTVYRPVFHEKIDLFTLWHH